MNRRRKGDVMEASNAGRGGRGGDQVRYGMERGNHQSGNRLGEKRKEGLSVEGTRGNEEESDVNS